MEVYQVLLFDLQGNQVFTSVVQVWFIVQVWVFSISLLKQEDKDTIVINSIISFFMIQF